MGWRNCNQHGVPNPNPPMTSNIAGALLLLAALSKANALIVFSNVFILLFGFSQFWASILAVEIFSIELFIGILLISYRSDFGIRIAGSVLYSIFGLVQLYKYLYRPDFSCGCFDFFQGAISMGLFKNALWAMILDFGIAALLFRDAWIIRRSTLFRASSEAHTQKQK